MLTLSPALTAYLLFVTAVLGLVMGSFCNAWAWRLAHGESIARGRSHCAVCAHTLAPRDLVPLFSYLSLKGRCRYCGAPIGKRYPAAEVVSALVFLSIVLRFDLLAPLVTLRWLLLGCLLLTASLVDLETQELPNRLLAGIALVFVVLVPPAQGFAGVKTGVLGALAVSVPLLLFVLLADRVMGKETMGGGDIKLLAVLGLHFGAAQMLMLLIFACFFGILFAVLRGRSKAAGMEKSIPFGPAISAAAWLVMLTGQPLLRWYVGLF